MELSKSIALGTGVDNHIQSIKRTYNELDRLQNITSFSNSDGTGTVRNEIQYEYNELWQITKIYQSHEGAVNTSTTPAIEYTYDDTSSSEEEDGGSFAFLSEWSSLSSPSRSPVAKKRQQLPVLR